MRSRHGVSSFGNGFEDLTTFDGTRSIDAGLALPSPTLTRGILDSRDEGQTWPTASIYRAFNPPDLIGAPAGNPRA